MTDRQISLMLANWVQFAPSRGESPPQPGGNAPERNAHGNVFATPILVVEDESMIAWMLEDVLLEAGFTSIELASTGEDAEQSAASDRPGLIISDVNLGRGKDGIAAARVIRDDIGPIPLIFVTAYADDAIRDRLAVELPGAQLLRKPVVAAALIGAVMRALAH